MGYAYPNFGSVRAMMKNASHHAKTLLRPLPKRPIARSSVPFVPRLIWLIASRCSSVNSPLLATSSPGPRKRACGDCRSPGTYSTSILDAPASSAFCIISFRMLPAESYPRRSLEYFLCLLLARGAPRQIDERRKMKNALSCPLVLDRNRHIHL